MTVRLKGIEQLLYKIKGLLAAGLPAKVLAINTEKGDTLLSEIPSGQYFVENEAFSKIPQYPAILILGTRTEIDPDQYGRVGILAHDVLIVVDVEDRVSAEQAFQTVARYGRAVVEILYEIIPPFAIDSTSEICQFSLREMDYSATITDKNRFRKSVALFWRFFVDEDND
jgi:hypothetical protein